jgi:hypothetical protein
VHGEGNGGGGGSSGGAIKTDRQVGLEEVGLQQAGLLDGPALVDQGRESVGAGVDHEGRAHPNCEPMAHGFDEPGMDGEGHSARRFLNRRDQFHVEGQSARSHERDSSWKADGESVRDGCGGAVGLGDEGKDEPDVTGEAGLSHSRRGECSEKGGKEWDESGAQFQRRGGKRWRGCFRSPWAR